MANHDKTEKATWKRRREAREKGQVARSVELNSAVVLVGGVVALSFMGPKVVTGAGAAMGAIFGMIARPASVSTGAGLHGLEEIVEHTLLSTLAPILGICLVFGLISNFAQVGFKPSLKALKPSFGGLNPLSGIKNVFGIRLVFEGGKALFKVAVIGSVVAMALIPQVTHLNVAVGTTPFVLGSLLEHSAVGILERAAAVYLLMAFGDLVWQRRRLAKSLRMTKEEVKEENKQADLPPEVKKALRRRMIQAIRARMMAAVPSADVVVTNPTHYAVALRYDGTKPAPVVVAKGKDLVAAQIRRLAAEHGVAIVPDPPLARSLYKLVEIDQMIPVELYAAVAQVLAYVYRAAGRRRAVAA